MSVPGTLLLDSRNWKHSLKSIWRSGLMCFCGSGLVFLICKWKSQIRWPLTLTGSLTCDWTFWPLRVQGWLYLPSAVDSWAPHPWAVRALTSVFSISVTWSFLCRLRAKQVVGVFFFVVHSYSSIPGPSQLLTGPLPFKMRAAASLYLFVLGNAACLNSVYCVVHMAQMGSE